MTMPSLDECVNAFRTATAYMDATLTQHRAPVKETTMFGPAGKATLHSNGERVIYGPKGEIIGRVTEDPHGNTQIEEDDRLHAVIRLRPMTVTVDRKSRKVVSVE